jgi:HD-like signal output (HDOD) protein
MVAARNERPGLGWVVREIADVRPLGVVASAVLRIADGDEFSARELAHAISADPALTAKMLRLANSAYYGYPRRIGTVHDAVVLLGFRAVRSAVLASCVIEAVGSSASLDYRQFWRFSVTVGVLAEIAAQVERGRSEEAFTAGVMHNIGRLALDQHLPEMFAEAKRVAARRRISLHDAERELLGFTDAELGGALTLHWSLPQELADAVRHHPLNVYAVPEEEGTLTAYVVRGRRFARAYGLSDGVEVSSAVADPHEWARPPLATALQRTGGMEGVLERVAAFLDHTLVR